MATRRSLLAALAATTTLVAAGLATEASSKPPFRKWGQTGVGGGGGGGGSFTITGSGYGDAAYTAFAPRAIDRKVMRSFQPTAADSAIWPQEECALPRSSAATSWIVGGTDVADFEAGTTGSIQFTAACRTGGVRKNRVLTLTPVRFGSGSGPAITLTVGMTPNASDEYFVQYSAANQSGNGSFATPWKYMPGSADYSSAFSSSSWASGAGADKCVFMKAEIHRTTHATSKTGIGGVGPSHSGTAGHQFWVEMNGWGGRATLDGSEVVTGWTTVTQAEVGGNANYASIRKLDLTSNGGYMELFQRLYDGATQCYPSQWPTPVDLKVNELIDYDNAITTERYGIRNYPCQTTGGTRRMYTNGASASAAGTKVIVVDPDFATMFGSVTLASLGPIRAIIRNGSNFFFQAPVTAYDFATSTIEVATNSAIYAGLGYASFALTNWPGHILTPGQSTISADGMTLYAWLPNNSTTSISRRYMAVPWGQGGSYITYSGGTYQRYAAGTLTEPSAVSSGITNKNSGTFMNYRGSGYATAIDVANAWFSQCNSDDGSGALYSFSGAGSGGGGILGTNIELCLFTEMNRSSCIRLVGTFNGASGLTPGDWAGVIAGTTGKIRGNAAADYASGQTFVYLACSDGVHFTLNHVRNFISLHGNFASPYDASSSAYNVNLKIDFNFMDDGARFFTNEVYKVGGNYVSITDNVVLNTRNAGAAFQLNGGLEQGQIRRNLIMGGEAGYNYNYALLFGSGGTGFEMDHNAISGFDTSAGANWRGNIHDNLLMVNQQPPASALGGTYASQTVATGAPVMVWNGTFTAQQIAAFGAGPIGCFHSV